MKAGLITALVFALAGPALAGFAQPTQAVKLSYGQQQTTLVFEADSAITKAKPHCDCTTVSFSGNKLTAVVDTSDFDTSVDKTISVTTADGKQTTLTMKFDVPQAVIFSPASLIWKVGESPTPKVLRITVPAGSPVKSLKEAGLEGDDFIYDAAKGKRKGEYTVTVTPKSTAKRLRNRLVIKMDSSDPRFSQRIILVRVNK